MLGSATPPPPLFHLIFQSKRKIGLWHARTAENMKAGRQPHTRTGRQPGRLTACGVVQISTTCFHCIGISQKRRVSNNGGTLQYKSISKSKNGNLQNVTVGSFSEMVDLTNHQIVYATWAWRMITYIMGFAKPEEIIIY